MIVEVVIECQVRQMGIGGDLVSIINFEFFEVLLLKYIQYTRRVQYMYFNCIVLNKKIDVNCSVYVKCTAKNSALRQQALLMC